jgi:hypothetical protein
MVRGIREGPGPAEKAETQDEAEMSLLDEHFDKWVPEPNTEERQ